MLTRVEDIHDQLVAFYPEYTDRGNMTRVIYKSDRTGTESSGHDPRQVESVKLALARCYTVDLRAQTKSLRARYCRQIVLHFHLPDGRVFVPFKLRESLIRGDACYGYIDLDHLARLVPGDTPCVMLRSGTRLPLFCSISTARLLYFIGLEILSDFVIPPEDADLDLVNALAVLRDLLAGQLPESKSRPSRRFRIKFLPTY
jgi:hypothetical protein